MNIDRAAFLQQTVAAKKMKNLIPTISVTQPGSDAPTLVPAYYFVNNRFWKKSKPKTYKMLASDDSSSSINRQKKQFAKMDRSKKSI